MRFPRKDNSTIDQEDEDMFSAFAISLTFIDQKNGEKDERNT